MTWIVLPSPWSDGGKRGGMQLIEAARHKQPAAMPTLGAHHLVTDDATCPLAIKLPKPLNPRPLIVVEPRVDKHGHLEAPIQFDGLGEVLARVLQGRRHLLGPFQHRLVHPGLVALLAPVVFVPPRYRAPLPRPAGTTKAPVGLGEGQILLHQVLVFIFVVRVAYDYHHLVLLAVFFHLEAKRCCCATPAPSSSPLLLPWNVLWVAIDVLLPATATETRVNHPTFQRNQSKAGIRRAPVYGPQAPLWPPCRRLPWPLLVLLSRIVGIACQLRVLLFLDLSNLIQCRPHVMRHHPRHCCSLAAVLLVDDPDPPGPVALVEVGLWELTRTAQAPELRKSLCRQLVNLDQPGLSALGQLPGDLEHALARLQDIRGHVPLLGSGGGCPCACLLVGL